MKLDEDGQQEYHLAVLEGCDHDTAMSRARSAVDRVNSRRLSGPITGDTRSGHGVRPIISDMWDYLDTATPVTQDTRSDVEREHDWARSDMAHRCLGLLTDRQRAVLSDYYGLETGVPMSTREVADKWGFRPEKVWRYQDRARKRLQAVTNVTEMGVAFS